MYIISNDKNIIDVGNIEEIDSINPSDIIYIESNNNGMSMTFEQLAKSLGVTLGSTPKFNGNINDDSTKNTYDVWGASWDSLSPPTIEFSNGSCNITHPIQGTSIKLRVTTDSSISVENIIYDKFHLQTSFESGTGSWRNNFVDLDEPVLADTYYYSRLLLTTSRALTSSESQQIFYNRPVPVYYSNTAGANQLSDYFLSGIAKRKEDVADHYWNKFGFFSGEGSSILSSAFTQSFRGGILCNVDNLVSIYESFSYTLDDIKNFLDRIIYSSPYTSSSGNVDSSISIRNNDLWIERSLPFSFTPISSCRVYCYAKSSGYRDSLISTMSITI